MINYWILAHNPKLFSYIKPQMISIQSTKCPLFSYGSFLLPHNLIYQIKTNSFQEFLFSHIRDPKSILKLFLQINPRNNLQKIQTFFYTFRAESDFELISNLSEFEQKQGRAFINFGYGITTDYIYASVSKHNFEDRVNN